MIINSLKGKNINDVALNMLNTNPQFKQFYEENKNKTIEEVAKNNGIDLSLIRQFL